MFDRGFGSAVRSEGSKEAKVFLMVWLMEVAMWTLIETAVFLPMSQMVTIGAEGFSAVSFRDGFEVPEEG